MVSTDLVFLNATGRPALARKEAKAMRAHISKQNFASRRRRELSATEGMAARESSRVNMQRKRKLCFPNQAAPASLLPKLPVTEQTNPHLRAQFLKGFRSFVFLDARNILVNPREVAWFDLILSEPALFEACLAVGTQLWSPELLYDLQAGLHRSKAIGILQQRIDSGEALGDGLLCAVLTMAFGDRLAGNDFGWSVHINGLAQMIRERRLRGLAVPSWVSDLILFDSVNAAFGFPRVYHPSLIEALGDQASKTVSRVAAISNNLTDLQSAIDVYHSGLETDQGFVVEKIEGPLSALHSQLQTIHGDDSPWVRAASRAIELFLHAIRLSRPKVDLTPIAGKLKDALCELDVRPCPYMDLTSIHYMLGATSARTGSPTRAWFIERLKTVVQAMQKRGWATPLGVFESRVTTHEGLIDRFRAIWREVANSDG